MSNNVKIVIETVDPAALPADYVAGNQVMMLGDLKGIPLVHQRDLTRDFDEVKVLPSPAAGATVNAAVASSTTVQTLLASNSARVGVTIANTDAFILFVKEGSGASLTDFSHIVAPYGLLHLPTPIYTGALTGIWEGDGSGSALVTERT
jgi:hypothetical protein